MPHARYGWTTGSGLYNQYTNTPSGASTYKLYDLFKQLLKTFKKKKLEQDMTLLRILLLNIVTGMHELHELDILN